MAVFSTNQNRQFYFATAKADNKVAVTKGNGKIFVGTDKDGAVYILQGGKGGKVRSDLIDPASVTYAKFTAGANAVKKLKKVTLSLSDEVNGGSIIPGEDYIVRVNIYQAFGMSDEDIYQKYGAVRGTKAMADDASKFWVAMADSLVKNFKRLYSPLVDIVVNGKTVAGSKKVEGVLTLVDTDGANIDASGVTSIDLVEKSQVDEWKLGTAKLVPVYFEVNPTTVFEDGVDVIWGVTENGVSDETIPNGYDLADLEYFCMGERGDQYRMKGFPNNITTEYFIGSAGANKSYDVIDIHYAYQGTCEDIQKSEKDIIIVGEAGNLADIKTALQTALKVTL